MLSSDFVLSSSTQSVSQILAYISSRKRVFWCVVFTYQPCHRSSMASSEHCPYVCVCPFPCLWRAICTSETHPNSACHTLTDPLVAVSTWRQPVRIWRCRSRPSFIPTSSTEHCWGRIVVSVVNPATCVASRLFGCSLGKSSRLLSDIGRCRGRTVPFETLPRPRSWSSRTLVADPDCVSRKSVRDVKPNISMTPSAPMLQHSPLVLGPFLCITSPACNTTVSSAVLRPVSSSRGASASVPLISPIVPRVSQAVQNKHTHNIWRQRSSPSNPYNNRRTLIFQATAYPPD